MSDWSQKWYRNFEGILVRIMLLYFKFVFSLSNRVVSTLVIYKLEGFPIIRSIDFSNKLRNKQTIQAGNEPHG